VRGATVVVLGVAYKRDVDDVRESPAIDVIGLLKGKGANVVYNDPHVASFMLENERLYSQPYSRDMLQNADCVIILTDHSTYDWQEITDCSHLIIDTRHAIPPRNGNAKVVLL
jgi:UDP-N-acetyl-D-glucosamine dehydrogenase